MTNLAQYVSQFIQAALYGQQTYGIPASTLLAISGSESNYGAAPTYFGISCAPGSNGGSWQCQPYTSQGSDCPGCVGYFRAYSSYQAAVDDFASLVQTSYPTAWANRGSPDFVSLLQQEGYTPATDWPGLVSQIDTSLAPYLAPYNLSSSGISADTASPLDSGSTGGGSLPPAQTTAFGLPSLGFLTDPIGYLRKAFTTPFETAGVFILGIVVVGAGLLLLGGKSGVRVLSQAAQTGATPPPTRLTNANVHDIRSKKSGPIGDVENVAEEGAEVA